MRAARLQELQEIVEKLLATARELPPGQDHHNALREIGRFRAQIAALQGADLRPAQLELGEEEMIKPKRSAEQQVADEADRKALNPLASRQTISDSQGEPEFQETHKRLKAERLAREAAEKAKGK
jgi:hypothetical protein